MGLMRIWISRKYRLHRTLGKGWGSNVACWSQDVCHRLFEAKHAILQGYICIL